MTYPLRPQTDADLSDELKETLSRYPAGPDGSTLSLFRVFANSERFLSGKGVANLLDRDSPLSLRERELVILRVTGRLACEYEWGVHVAAFSQLAGLSASEIAATRAEPLDGAFQDRERSLLDVVDALLAFATVPERLRQEFQTRWTQAQQLEVMALCSHYHLVSSVANVSGIAPEAYGVRFGDGI